MRTYHIGIDCGVKYIGISLFEDVSLTVKELLKCEFIKSSNEHHETQSKIVLGIIDSLKKSNILCDIRSDDKVCVLIEYPEQYQYSPVPRNNVQDLAFTAGALGLFFEMTFKNVRVDLILPKDWKRQVPKDIFLNRILSRLSENELKILNEKNYAKSIKHNVIDSIGLGLYLCRRL